MDVESAFMATYFLRNVEKANVPRISEEDVNKEFDTKFVMGRYSKLIMELLCITFTFETERKEYMWENV